ncbi:MAG TPA: zinc ABC transporter substrate-binding protein [Cellulomonadaceae bacterium]|nr:zinc ABC transporter substrate-binding protein [Cellulomonadaceae bacterium]
MRPASRNAVAALAAVTALIALGACSTSGSTSSAPSGSTSGTIAVVASTNVWGDLVQTIGGSAVTVTSIISDPNADPHSYEANAQTELAIAKAAVVIENGGGYDDFVATMVKASGTKATVLDAVTISGKKSVAGQLNEHVWYDFASVDKVVAAISAALTAADPAQADLFSANASALTAQVAGLQQQLAAVKAAHAGAGVAITEPVPVYLLDGAGLVDRTPAAFSAAIEAQTDVPPAVMQSTLALFTQHDVAALVYNEQAVGPQTTTVLDAARRAGVPVVPVTETLPAGKTYVTWMSSTITALASALGK